MADAEANDGGLRVEDVVAADAPSPAASAFAGFADELRRFIVGVVRDPSLADDVMQTTFIKAAERGHDARAGTAKGWLFRVAYNEALAARRREGSLEKHRKRMAGLRPNDPSGPDERLIRGETVAAVRRAIATLSEDQRRVVLARVYDEKTFAEIAAESGLPLGTVLTRMRRALEKLRRTMRPGG